MVISELSVGIPLPLSPPDQAEIHDSFTARFFLSISHRALSQVYLHLFELVGIIQPAVYETLHEAIWENR